MSIDLFKKQAERLIKFMGDKHRMRLKSAGALEAIAAINDARDWKTLAACANQRTVPPDTAEAATGTNVLSWRDGVPDIMVPAQDWSRHTIAAGGLPAI